MGKAESSVDLADSDVEDTDMLDSAINNRYRVLDADEDKEASNASQGKLWQLGDTRVLLLDWEVSAGQFGMLSIFLIQHWLALLHMYCYAQAQG